MKTAIAGDLIRRNILDLPAYVAGKASDDPNVIKVASNEMPFPTLPAVQKVVADHMRHLGQYPDAGVRSLTAAIAEHIFVDPDMVCVGNGSVSLIEKILAAVADSSSDVVMPWRSFEAYPIAIQLTGARAVAVPLEENGNCDLQAMAQAITDRTRAVLICTPNNPTAAALTHTQVREFMLAVPRNVLVLLDEAYVDFVRMADPVRGIELAKEFANLLVLRTFSKAYGLAGLRIGYAVGDPSVIAALKSSNTPFAVNTLAQYAAVAALGQREEVDRRVNKIVDQRAAVVSALREAGWKGPDPQANFVWFDIGEDADRFDEVCLRHGIIVRTFSGSGVRVTIAQPQANERLLAAYREWVKDNE